MSWKRPPMRSCIAGAAPLYGMCVMSMPARVLKSSPARWPALPVLPEPKLSLPGFDISTWFGIFVPAGTPGAVVEKLHAEFTRALAAPDVRERMLALGAEPVANRPEEFAAYIRAEADKYARLVKASGAKAD